MVASYERPATLVGVVSSFFRGIALALALGGLGWCSAEVEPLAQPPARPPAAVETVAAEPAPTEPPALASASFPPAVAPAAERLVLIAGGDVSFGRSLGQQLLRESNMDVIGTLEPWFSSADIRFVNLESQLSDQKGETQSPDNKLVFTGPPAGADALARGRVSIVSLANNHAWDYGRLAFLETLANLERVDVQYVGAGRSRERAYGPVILDRGGFRLGFLAVTDIWNQGPLKHHVAAEFVARAERDTLAAAVEELRASGKVDAIVVSYHGGEEYVDQPLEGTREILRAAIDAGADVVIGHHPHVLQGIEWRGGKPIFYSLGNLLMQPTYKAPESAISFLARLAFRRNGTPVAEICPYQIVGTTAGPLKSDGVHGDMLRRGFVQRIARVSRFVGGTTIGAFGADGCLALEPPGANPNRGEPNLTASSDRR